MPDDDGRRSGELVRWGVISTANIGIKAVIPAIQASCNGRLVAIASRDLTRAEAVALRERGARAYGSYEALLADPDVDAVYMPLPNARHLEWTVKAAAAGKHVLCEEPLGLTEAEVGKMYDACERRFAVVDQYQLQVERFAECVRTGEAPPCGREDALAQARGIEMIYASAGYRWPR